jgi:putative addiction module component (TIGR02574 family)
MAATLERVTKDALALPDEARLALAECLVESVHAHPDPGLEARQMDEVRRRIEEVRSGRVQLIPGDEALREVRDAVRHAK